MFDQQKINEKAIAAKANNLKFKNLGQEILVISFFNWKWNGRSLPLWHVLHYLSRWLPEVIILVSGILNIFYIVQTKIRQYGPTMIDEHQFIELHYHCKLKDTSYTTVQLAWPSLRFAVRWRRNNIAYFPLTKIPGIPNGKSQIHRHAVFSVWLMEHSINEFSIINL